MVHGSVHGSVYGSVHDLFLHFLLDLQFAQNIYLATRHGSVHGSVHSSH